MLLLEGVQYLGRSLQHGFWHTREPGDVNPVTAAPRFRCDLVQEDDFVFQFALSTRCNSAIGAGRWRVAPVRGSAWRIATGNRWSGGIPSSPTPAKRRRRCWCRGRFRPESQGCRGVALLRMFAASVISTMKVLWPRLSSSLAPTRGKIRSVRPTVADFAGTKLPSCASSVMR